MPSDTCPYVLRDLEAEGGQHRARQRHDHEIALDEVVGAADDAARRDVLARRVGHGRIVVGADVDAAPVDRLAVLLLLLDQVQDPADHERAADARGDDLLELEVEGRQTGREIHRRQVRGQVDVLAEPGNRCAH
jgi:hypothetical protein